MKRRANHVREKCSSRDLGPKALDRSGCSIFQTAISFEPFNCFCNPLCIKTESRHMLISCKRCNIVNDFQWRFGASFQCSSFFICSADSCFISFMYTCFIPRTSTSYRRILLASYEFSWHCCMIFIWLPSYIASSLPRERCLWWSGSSVYWKTWLCTK